MDLKPRKKRVIRPLSEEEKLRAARARRAQANSNNPEKSYVTPISNKIEGRRARAKIRKILHRQKHRTNKAREQMDQSVDEHFLSRLNRLLKVRRFITGWMLLSVMLIGGAWWQSSGLDSYYLRSAPTSGGVYREGIIGSFTNSNPLYATSGVDAAVSRLLYSGLFSVNGDGTLQPRLATKYTLDSTQKVYTVDLRRDVYWHDGEHFDADDVLFTYKTIQNYDARSPRYAGWQSVKVEKTDEYQVTFTLPNIYSAFHYSLTNGIVPEHILSKEDVSSLRSSNFNTTKAIGTGEFKLGDITVSDSDDVELRSERVVLTRNDGYFSDKAQIDGIVLRTYRNEDLMVQAFKEDTIQSMIGLNNVSDEVAAIEDVRVITAPLTSSVMAFMNNSAPQLSDRNVRRALVQAVNTSAVREALKYEAIGVDGPFLRSQPTYDPEVIQLGYDPEAAKKTLDEAGWLLGDNGIREKEGQQLQLRLFSQSLGEYSDVIGHIQSDWTAIGVNLQVFLQSESDIQSGAIARHDYDVLLYGISIGYDPDVYAYWHSSQIDNPTGSSLNLSEFRNETADDALEAGRTRNDMQLRKVKYRPFLEAWREEAPAVALYQPRFTMVVRGTFEGFDASAMRSGTDRYRSVSAWQIRNAKVPKIAEM